MRRWTREIRRLLAVAVALSSLAAALLALRPEWLKLPDFVQSVLPDVLRPDAPPAPGRADFSGAALVHDGDTLTVANRRIRLDGIDAPELRQGCERGGFTWPCGADATAMLAQRLRGRILHCAGNGRDQYGRVLAHCWLGEEDIGGWMVREGLAVAYTRYSRRYVGQEREARREGRGLWAGRFENPEDWRRRNPR